MKFTGKLSLSKETLHVLSPREQQEVQGAQATGAAGKVVSNCCTTTWQTHMVGDPFCVACSC